jgi:Protein of unknown function (DUF4019)
LPYRPSNPLEDIKVLAQPRFVMKNGEVIRNTQEFFMSKRCTFLTITAALALALLAGCNDIKQAPKDAERLDTDLHSAMTRGDIKGIYANADDGLKSAISEEKFDALFAAIAKKLGTPISCTPGGWNLNTDTSGTFLKTECQTKFSKNASGTETITWRKSGETYRLFDYHINSDELLER